MQVACYVPKYADEEPLIGTITALPCGENIESEWMAGSYSDTWIVCKTRKGKKYVTWKECIPISTVLFPVELTKGGRLTKHLTDKLKHTYARFR